jgi:hypothetical protein
MTSSRVLVSDFEGRLGVEFKYNTFHTFLFNLYGRQMCLFCLQLGFSSRKIITKALYLVSMLSCCMYIAACNLGFTLLQALDPVACTVLFKMSLGLCSNLVLFATPWRRRDEWKCSYTLLDLDTRCRWVVSFSPLPLHSALLPCKEPEGASRFPLDRGQRQPRIRSGCSGEKKIDTARNRIQFLRLCAMFMPFHHCMTCTWVAGLLLFLDRCLSFFRSFFLDSLLVLFSILFFDFNAAVGSNSWMYSVQWLDYSWKLNWKDRLSRNICNLLPVCPA